MKMVTYSSICVLCVTLGFFYDIAVVQSHSHSPTIIKSVNTTTIIGESVVFDCAQHTEFHDITDLVLFKWTFNGKPLKHDNRILLENNKRMNITSITIHDKGKYECFISYQPGINYNSVFFLNVHDLTYQIIHRVSSIKYTNYVGGSLYWTCNPFNEGSIYNFEYTWLKNKKPLHLDLNNRRISIENNNMSLRITSIKTDDKGTYECLASNQIQKESSVFEFSVIHQPQGNKHEMFEETTTRYINESVSWNCSLTSDHLEVNKYNYVWFKNGAPLHLLKNDQKHSLKMNNFTLQITNLNHGDSGFYFCNISNGLVIGSHKRTLTVVDLPKKDIYSWYFSNLKLIINAIVQLRCKTLHSSIKYKTSFKWMKNNKQLILSDDDNVTRLTNNNQTLVLQAVKSGQDVTYTCEASNVHHTFYSKYTYNTVDPENLQFYNESKQITTIHIGESVEWWCYVYGMPPPQIKWYKDGLPFDVPENDKSRVFFREFNQNLLINSTNLKDKGNYECRALNRIGDICVVSFKLDFNGTAQTIIHEFFLTSQAMYIFYGVVIVLLIFCVFVDFICKRKRRAALKQRLILSSKTSNPEINNVDLK